VRPICTIPKEFLGFINKKLSEYADPEIKKKIPLVFKKEKTEELPFKLDQEPPKSFVKYTSETIISIEKGFSAMPIGEKFKFDLSIEQIKDILSKTSNSSLDYVSVLNQGFQKIHQTSPKITKLSLKQEGDKKIFEFKISILKEDALVVMFEAENEPEGKRMAARKAIEFFCPKLLESTEKFMKQFMQNKVKIEKIQERQTEYIDTIKNFRAQALDDSISKEETVEKHKPVELENASILSKTNEVREAVSPKDISETPKFLGGSTIPQCNSPRQPIYTDNIGFTPEESIVIDTYFFEFREKYSKEFPSGLAEMTKDKQFKEIKYILKRLRPSFEVKMNSFPGQFAYALSSKDDTLKVLKSTSKEKESARTKFIKTIVELMNK